MKVRHPEIEVGAVSPIDRLRICGPRGGEGVAQLETVAVAARQPSVDHPHLRSFASAEVTGGKGLAGQLMTIEPERLDFLPQVEGGTAVLALNRELDRGLGEGRPLAGIKAEAGVDSLDVDREDQPFPEPDRWRSWRLHPHSLAVRACLAVILRCPRIRRPRVSAPTETPWPILKERSV